MHTNSYSFITLSNFIRRNSEFFILPQLSCLFDLFIDKHLMPQLTLLIILLSTNKELVFLQNALISCENMKRLLNFFNLAYTCCMNYFVTCLRVLLMLQLRFTLKDLQDNDGYINNSGIAAAEKRNAELLAIKEDLDKSLTLNYQLRLLLQKQLQKILVSQNTRPNG